MLPVSVWEGLKVYKGVTWYLATEQALDKCCLSSIKYVFSDWNRVEGG